MSTYFPFGDRPLSIFLLAADKMKSLACHSFEFALQNLLHFKLDLSNKAALLNYYSASVLPRHMGSLLPDQHSSASVIVETQSKMPFLTHLLTKLQSPVQARLLVWRSVPLYWLQQPVLGPILASRDSASGAVTLGEVTIHLLRGGKMPAYPGKKLIFPVQQLDKQDFVQAGLRVQLLHCSQNRTGFLCWKFWCGGKTSLQYSRQSLNIVVRDGAFGDRRKWNCVSLWLYRSRSWDELYFPGWSSTSADNSLLFSRVIFWCDSGTSQRKRVLFKRNTPNQKAMFLKKACLQCTHESYLLLAFAFHADYSTTYSPAAHEQNQ